MEKVKRKTKWENTLFIIMGAIVLPLFMLTADRSVGQQFDDLCSSDECYWERDDMGMYHIYEESCEENDAIYKYVCEGSNSLSLGLTSLSFTIYQCTEPEYEVTRSRSLQNKIDRHCSFYELKGEMK